MAPVVGRLPGHEDADERAGAALNGSSVDVAGNDSDARRAYRRARGLCLGPLVGALQLLLLGMGAYVSIATAPLPSCYFGVSPFDGQSQVAIDTTLTFTSPVSIPEDLPTAKEGVAALYLLPEMELVPARLEVDHANQQFTLVPEAPLLLDRAYLAQGIYFKSYLSSNYSMSSELSGYTVQPATTEFRTGSSPRALLADAFALESELTRVTLVFSEAINPDTFNVMTIRFMEAETSIEDLEWTISDVNPGSDVTGEESGTNSDGSSEIEFIVSASSDRVNYVELDIGVAGESGEPLDGDGDFTGGEPEDSQLLVVVVDLKDDTYDPRYALQNTTWCEE